MSSKKVNNQRRAVPREQEPNMPITFFEGAREGDRDDLTERNMERRFYALAAAVKEHEARSRRGRETSREDENLYRRLRQLNGEPATAEHGAA
jgi:hypothetical protein